MSITIRQGNIFKSKCEALVNPVNTAGIMGKGLALEFKKEFPHNFHTYRNECDTGIIGIGKLITETATSKNYGKKIIVNFPTKIHWSRDSKIEYIDEGLGALKVLMQKSSIESIAIPMLGCGNGGLNKSDVLYLIVDKLVGVKKKIEIYI